MDLSVQNDKSHLAGTVHINKDQGKETENNRVS